MGMFAYVSDNVTGPYMQQPHNHALMAYEQGWVTPAYFATFFPTEEHGMLVNHQVSRVLRPCLSQPVGRIHKSHSMRSKHHPAARAASSAHHTAPRTRTHSRHFSLPTPAHTHRSGCCTGRRHDWWGLRCSTQDCARRRKWNVATCAVEWQRSAQRGTVSDCLPHEPHFNRLNFALNIPF